MALDRKGAVAEELFCGGPPFVCARRRALPKVFNFLFERCRRQVCGMQGDGL